MQRIVIITVTNEFTNLSVMATTRGNRRQLAGLPRGHFLNVERTCSLPSFAGFFLGDDFQSSFQLPLRRGTILFGQRFDVILFLRVDDGPQSFIVAMWCLCCHIELNLFLLDHRLNEATSTNNPTAVVTEQDIGNFVSVSGIGKGILRYVGEIRGRDGLYCGIELDAPSGKHNGTYQGVVYFVCPPLHGIFAPIYRVELDEIDDVPMMTVSQSSKAPERLTRSALPTLQLRNVFRPSGDFSTMQTSIGSDKMMDTSMFSNVSWGDSDAMVCSNATFVIPPGRSHLEDSEECDLMSIPEPKSILSINRDLIGQNENAMLGTSIVLDESRVGVENLPVVEDDDVDDDGDNGDDGDDDDLQTPLVETSPQWQLSSCSYSQQLPSIVDTDTTSTDATRLVSDHTTSKESSLRANSRQSVDTGYNDESDASRLEHEERSKSGENKEGGNVEKEVKSTRSRRMEKEPPPPPKFPVKPKTPSKHQLLMEQIKASIEADKLKPKKEVKARISFLPPPRAPPLQNENATDEKMPETPRRVAKQPLKTVNSIPALPPKPERPKKERKPLYVPPPPKGVVLSERKEVKTSTPLVRNGVERTIDSPNVSRIVETPPRQSSSKDGKSKKKAPVGLKASGAAETETSNNEKLQRLQSAVRAFEALCVVITQSETQGARLRSQLEEANEDIVARSQVEALERTKERYESQLAEKTKEAERALEDERSRHEAELEAMSRRHQKVVISLDEKIAEGERTIHQLLVDKKTLQTALANDSDQRNQMLTKEINSLQTALEFKSSEMKELRQKYQQVALRVEEIPVKELEITKLKHKVIELKQALDQKLTYEKKVILSTVVVEDRIVADPRQDEYLMWRERTQPSEFTLEKRLLVHQNEELKRQQLAIEEERESMQRNFDVMIYRYGEMDHSMDRDSLIRSTISMYASQVQLPENHADDVIYAPDEIITGNGEYVGIR
ncbi:unnamed protein product [Angiostrongylus costaricensis]|uniref:CAP-Gly domain-containing protein n=1 Tax=Angiostrongylus costaricensis TaxID=334426 RepID=A0A158PG16_ANGCS|nr:unnamed protein product [Angiostrongylus costaricensis]